jgi:hypothetical protein
MELLPGARGIINELQLSGWERISEDVNTLVLQCAEKKLRLLYRKGDWDAYERDPGWWTEVWFHNLPSDARWKSQFWREDPSRPLEEFLVWLKDDCREKLK